MKLLLDPHGDDGVLFASWTIQRERPLVVVIYDSYIQVQRGAAYCDALTRKQETTWAMNALGQFSHYMLGADGLPDDAYIESGRRADWRPQFEHMTTIPLKFCGLRDDSKYTEKQVLDAILASLAGQIPEHIYIPAFEHNGHAQHNLVAQAGHFLAALYGVPYTAYTTYTRTGGKTRTTHPVPIEDPEWIECKLHALGRFHSQIRLENCRPHFLRDLEEYYL